MVDLHMRGLSPKLGKRRKKRRFFSRKHTLRQPIVNFSPELNSRKFKSVINCNISISNINDSSDNKLIIIVTILIK